MRYGLLTAPHANPKTRKNIARGYWTASLALAPHTFAGDTTVCPAATPGCSAACLFHAGRGRAGSVATARVRRTLSYWHIPDWFFAQLRADLEQLRIEAANQGLAPACRLNVTSDIAWERTSLLDDHPDIQFYDYTKRRDRTEPDNYHLTFSRSELNWAVCERVLSQDNRNISAVFLARLPTSYRGWSVIDGDEHDVRWRDPSPCIVGLRAKGAAASADRSGFVIRLDGSDI